MTIDPSWLIPILTLAAAAGGAKVTMNGTKDRVKTISRQMDEHIKHDAEIQAQLLAGIARVEGKIDVAAAITAEAAAGLRSRS